jgi:hypothetical protein
MPARPINVIVGLLFLSLPAVANRPPESAAEWVSCVDSLELPTDSILTSLLGSSSTVNAVVTFGANGEAHFHLDTGTEAARREVLSSLKLSRFRGKKCANKSIALSFTFVMEGEPVSDIYPTRTTYQAPNRFTFYVRPRHPIYDLAPSGSSSGGQPPQQPRRQ